MEMMNRYGETLHIQSYEDNKDISGRYEELLTVINQFYYTVERVDLRNETVSVLQCAENPESIGKVFNWVEFLTVSSGIFIGEQRQHVLEKLSVEHLLKLYRSGKKFYTVDAQYLKGDVLNNMTFFVTFTCIENTPLAYVLVRNSFKEHLRKHIVDLYVYKNCDYFIYLDAKNNSYAMFTSAENGTQMPPELYDDYEAEVEKYVNEIIAPEDREMALREMSLQQVLSQLEHKEVHSFYCGITDPARGYTRKRFDYRYYERNTKMILLSCTDITEMYLKEQEQRRALFNALKSAQTDTLTGLLNYKGIVENIYKAIDEKPEHAALLFIDVDNFKIVNDTLGHDVGDHVLCEIAVILCEESFGEPLVGRFGGDEFVVFFPDVNSMDEIKAYAGRVCSAVAAMEYGQREDKPHISCSIGIAETSKGSCDSKTLIKRADAMAYRAKFTGKNKFIVYE